MYYTASSQKILEFISKYPGSSPKHIIEHLKLNDVGVFRHLKKMQEKNLLYKVGKPPKVRYYSYVHTMEEKSTLIPNALNWAISGDARLLIGGQFCETRDIFQTRNDHVLNDLKRIIKDDGLCYLIVAIVGEIGNNSFDHNLGNWQGAPGVFFTLDAAARTIIISDRGQGIFTTIQRVRPDVHDSSEALRIAFTEMISGRAPEQRGNGLKFVKKVTEEKGLYLKFYTGGTIAEITNRGMVIKKSPTTVPGMFCYLTF